MKDTRRPLLVIDGDSFAHRSSCLAEDDTARGQWQGRSDRRLRQFSAAPVRKRAPSCAVLVGWDTLNVPTYRQRLFPGYQGGRQFDHELIEQLDLLPQFVAACGFASAKAPGYEADDFLAAAATREQVNDGTAIIVSGDRDAFQMASGATSILQPAKAGEMARIGPAEVRERYGVDPNQLPDFIALRGDPSDKLPGAKGVGPKGATALLRRYGTLERAVADDRLRAQADDLLVYKRIATMDAAAPIPELDDQVPTWPRAAALAREWELNRLAERLDALSAGGCHSTSPKRR